MNWLKFHFTLFLCISAFASYSQEKKYDISKPVDINQTGWNKVLCMKNGNTMLFHFEPGRNIFVRVFDSTHRQISARKDASRLFDVTMLPNKVIKGIYDINGEAVLFVDQDYLSKHQLVRLRFSAVNGMLLEEKLIAESKNENKRMRFYVMKNKNDDNYQVFFCTDVRHPVKQCDLFIAYFNNRHESVREIQLDVDRKKYDYLEVLDAESQPEGTLITVGLTKKVMFGALNYIMPIIEDGSRYDHYLLFFYIPKDSSRAQRRLVNVTENVFPDYSLYTYNSFAGTLNSLLFSNHSFYYKFGINLFKGHLFSDHFFKIGADDMSVSFNRIKDSIADRVFKQQTDTFSFFNGIPVKMYTNENGLSTLISLSETRVGEPETRAKYDYQDFLGNIGITQLDDDGNEIWGTILPFSQYYNSHKYYYSAKDVAKRAQEQILFGDNPPQVYNRQFVSVNTYALGNNLYIVYNDYDKNYNNTIKNPGDTVYTFDNTNAFYYKISSKKVVTKDYLFGLPGKNEYKCSAIESADFDEQRGIYATLVQYKKNGNITMRMAWRYLD